MKQFILPTISLLFTLQLSAQIVIERTDYTLTPGVEAKGWRMATAGLSAPEEGADVTWDYSGQALTSAYNFVKDSISGDPTFPEANLTDLSSDILLGLVDVPVVFYERLDDDGFGTLGRIASSVSLPAAPLTGGMNDTIVFLGDTSIYEESTYYSKFPLAYQDSWQTNITIRPDFLITVAAFGLNQAPAQQISRISQNSTVVGYGTLILPNPDGSGSSVSMEALLLRRDRSSVDSFFLAGQPAPAIMLDVLGLVQGAISMRSDYSFYVKGLPRTALGMSVRDGSVTGVTISDDVKNLVSSTRFTAPDLAATKVFPNPTTGSFQVEFEKTDAQIWTLHVFNSLGQQVNTMEVQGGKGQQLVHVFLADDERPGLYQIVLRNGQNTAVAAGRVLKN